jgi:uncharacterized protein involved in copper resistance
MEPWFHLTSCLAAAFMAESDNASWGTEQKIIIKKTVAHPTNRKAMSERSAGKCTPVNANKLVGGAIRPWWQLDMMNDLACLAAA